MKTVKKTLIIALAFILTLATTLNVFAVDSSEISTEAEVIISESTEQPQEQIILEETTVPDTTETVTPDISEKIYGITLNPDKIFMLPNDTFQLEVGFLTSPPENPLRTEFIEEEATEVLVTEAQIDEELTEASETTTDIQEETTKAEEETTVIAEESTTYPEEITETTVAESEPEPETETETATEHTTVTETEEYTETPEIVTDAQSEVYAENISGIISDSELALEPITEEENETLDLIWSSSDEAVAAIGLNGLIYSRELGTATVTASTPDGVFTASCEVSVVEEIPEENSASVMPLDAAYEVALSPNTSWSDKPGHWAVKVSTEFTVNFDVYKCDDKGNYTGSEADISSLVNWQSSDTSVATVDIYGRVTGLKEGSTTITVSAKNGDNISVYNPIHVTVYTPYSSTRPGMAKAWVSQYKSTIADCHTDRQAGVVSPGTLLTLLGTSGGYILGTIQGQTGQYFMWANNLYDQTNGTVTICKSGTTSDTRRHWDMYTTQTVTLALTDGASATWTTSDSSIAKINNYTTYTGKTATITPIAEGTAYITANSGGKIDVIHVTVITRFYDENGIKENKVGVTTVWCNNFKCTHTKCTILGRKDSITETEMMITMYGESNGFYYAHPHGTNKYIYIWKGNVKEQKFDIECELMDYVSDTELYAAQGMAMDENYCYSFEIAKKSGCSAEHRLFRYNINTGERMIMQPDSSVGKLYHANDAALVEFTENGVNQTYLFVATMDSELDESDPTPNRQIVQLKVDPSGQYSEKARFPIPLGQKATGITLLSGGGTQPAVFLIRIAGKGFYEVTIANGRDKNILLWEDYAPSKLYLGDTTSVKGTAQGTYYDKENDKLYLAYCGIPDENDVEDLSKNRVYQYVNIKNASGALSCNASYDVNLEESSKEFEIESISFRSENKKDVDLWFTTFEYGKKDSGIYTANNITKE